MPTLNFIAKNPELDFISGITIITSPFSTIYDINILTSRNILNPQWEQPLYDRIIEEGKITISFKKPVNFHYFNLNIFHENLSTPKIHYNKFTPISLDEVKSKIKNQKISFVGCARNCEDRLPSTIKKIIKLGSLFQEYKLFVFENDSSDKTREILKQYENLMPIKTITTENLSKNIPERTARLSYGRNLLLDQAKKINHDFICCVDMDGPVNENHPSETSFLDSFRYQECWDAVFPINENKYYDIWALRQRDLCAQDFMIEAANFDAALGRDIALQFTMSARQTDLRGLKSWLEVDSAFGGMAIYQSHSLDGERYHGLMSGLEVCEHVPFHLSMKKSGKSLLINPRFIISSH